RSPCAARVGTLACAVFARPVCKERCKALCSVRRSARQAGSQWREVNRGRIGQEVEGWPCSSAAKRQSGHPKVRSTRFSVLGPRFCVILSNARSPN
ncbi:unnamed protein product, partial [Effrenium voratum]